MGISRVPGRGGSLPARTWPGGRNLTFCLGGLGAVNGASAGLTGRIETTWGLATVDPRLQLFDEFADGFRRFLRGLRRVGPLL